ncbi:hypothetical protein [Chryseobacterium paridis]|uniref:Anti-sigma factor n=1 Tax=Chryseobacterium paridis TaxID=2800328 RepID=A0ABS1FR92_9FLAO|nr:hypothetical protein [Chryseobacterium paridis]MBK1894953.1 hypothetical protein [Chryseobacterium paridis]
MNTIKNNFENQIRKQIEEREIAPSRDLWSEIKEQTQAERPKSKLNWLLVAACLMLLFALGSVLVFYNKPDQSSPKVVKKDNSGSDVKKKTLEIRKELPVLVAQEEQKPVEEVRKANQDEKLKTPEVKAFTENKKQPLIREHVSEVSSNISETSAPIIAQADSSKMPVKKKRYVDPSTLLFSVEHKDVIEKTKDKSNVATINLNGR